ncbi:MAG: SRPBCC domain-containing protein [Dongiaceae bacterium]
MTETCRTPAAGAHELSLTRLIEATPEQCFRAWIERLPDWWGPGGATTPLCDLELRPGGLMRTVMRGPDGNAYDMRGVFLEIDPPHRIVTTDAYGPGWQPTGKPFMTALASFVAEGGGTRFTATARHWTEEDKAAHEAMGFHQGWGQSADRFAAVARTIGEAGEPLPELLLLRSLPAAPDAVWRAWTDAVQLGRWWGPQGFTNPVCEADVRPGGTMRVVMRAPSGEAYPMRGRYEAVEPGRRLVVVSEALAADGRALLEGRTTVTIAAEGEGARLAVATGARALVPEARPMLAGMVAGWSGSLERLAALLAGAAVT